ncbi:gliding motility lipoprotein GldH [Bacteroides heparinolyticus]|uniref:Gliding motility lipoprotein GldH n=7 Tax=Prevotella heparinolytica TaxID=28113 RepID=A0A3P2ABI1_9BACE|nr:gliding motility lipoprotein GldH [Bacteroides heparinolyticus]MCF0256076.1 gliding motility lipoprotein GldH [Bacteroides heparinolyticus]MCI6213049.1 gliding motility lipoprotein GldH [Bacteroides heparinolyticus]RRD92056.1 gliding motility lipoprotein GldH [Bacteroides heparinolyticus]TCO91115.1 gliding motility-associated lipoprotein GldH [Bacteroides heparinolyticus]
MTNPLKHRNLRLKGIILLFVASLWTACDRQTVYHAFQPLPSKGWQRTDTLFFKAEVNDSLTLYRLSVEVRNRNNYPYQNLNLSVCCTPPDSVPLPADTLQLTLADKTGAWQGNGWGGLYLTDFPAGNIRIGKPGTYLFKISHTLPDSILPGINDVGIRLWK